MVWLSSLVGILQLVVITLLIREIFGIRYETRSKTGNGVARGQDGDGQPRAERDTSESREVGDSLESRQVGRTLESRTVGSESGQGSDRGGSDSGVPDDSTIDDVAEDEESLRLTFENIEDVGNNLVKVFAALTDAVDNEAFDRVRALAAQGADLVSGGSNRSKSVQALLDQRSDLVEDAVSALEEVKGELETNLIKHADEATVEPMANMHESRADGLFYSDVEALETIPNEFFKDKVREYEAASTDEERVETWKEAYQVMSQLPQFYMPDWTDPRQVEDVVGKTVRVDGEERDKLRRELERMVERYEKLLEELPDDISADESHRQAEEELNLVHEALNIAEQHQRLLAEVGENYDAGDVTVGQDADQNAVSLSSVVELLGEQFGNVYADAEQADSKSDIDVSRLEELLQIFVQSVNQVHEALELYTSKESKEDTINELKRLAGELREKRENQRQGQ